MKHMKHIKRLDISNEMKINENRGFFPIEIEIKEMESDDGYTKDIINKVAEDIKRLLMAKYPSSSTNGRIYLKFNGKNFG